MYISFYHIFIYDFDAPLHRNYVSSRFAALNCDSSCNKLFSKVVDCAVNAAQSHNESKMCTISDNNNALQQLQRCHSGQTDLLTKIKSVMMLCRELRIPMNKMVSKLFSYAQQQQQQQQHKMNASCTWWPLPYYRRLRSKGYQNRATRLLITTTTTPITVTSMTPARKLNRRQRHQEVQFKLPRHRQRLRPALPSSTLQFFLYLCLLMHGISIAIAAPQSCVLCDKEELETKNSKTRESHENFFFEHQVTRMDAIHSLKALNESFYNGPPDCAIRCSDKVMRYCLGQQFINDHCWCELGHINEGLPFVPHICYVGEKVYKASTGSCYVYDEVKECCCAPALAKKWRYISAAARQTSNSSRQLLCRMLLILLIIGHRLRDHF